LGIDKTRRQRRQALVTVIARLATSAALGTLIVLCFYAHDYLTTTDKLAITQMDYHGLNRLDSEEVDRILADMRGENILLVPLENFAARFSQHPRIRDARFKRVLPNRVICTFSEREPVALLYSGEFMEVDEEGMVMEADELTGLLDLPIVTGLDGASIKEGRICGDERLTWALETLTICKKYGGRFADNISELRVGMSGISIVSLREGVVLLLGTSEFENRLRKYFLLENTIARNADSAKLIDLRFDDQIVLRNGI
jgi:cell division septal protein FtsQ